MQLRAADAFDPVVDGAPDELVREAARRHLLRQLLDHPATDPLFHGSDERGLVDPGRVPEHAQLEPGSGDGRELEHGCRLSRETRQALVHEVTDALGA